MKLRHTLTFLVLASLSLPALASSKNNNGFILIDSQSGKTVGKAAYSIQKSSKGYKVGGNFQYNLQAGQQGQYSFSSKLDNTGNLLSASVEDQSTQKTYIFQPNKNRTSVEFTTIQAGNLATPMSAVLPKPEVFMAPIGDPSGIQVLMTSALAHPHTPPIYLLLVPLSVINKINHYHMVGIQPDSDRTATLDGKSITLKSFKLRFHTGADGEVYLDDSGNLMEADLPKFGMNYVRKNFTLTPASSAK
ncbi:MAG: hypothetical protein ACP5E5_08645 [Acidobacteriaceae bacterium]